MNTKVIKSTREKTQENLKKVVDGLRLEIERVKMEVKTAKEKNHKKVSNLKRDLSQILTIIREKEISEENKSVNQ